MNLVQIPKRILIIRPSALGDVCRTVGVLASLRQAYPQAHIAWAVQDDFAAAIQSHPALNEVIAFPRRGFANWWRNPSAALRVAKWLATLRHHRFDLVVDCQGLARSGLMSLVSGARVRVGLQSAREFAWLAYNVRAPRAAASATSLHTVDEMLQLVQALGIEVVRDMRLYVADAPRQWWRTYREDAGIDGPYAVLAPTSRWLSKRWPIERFAQLVEPLVQRGFSRIVVIGSPSEADQVRGLFRNGPHPSAPASLIDMVGTTNIGQTMAVIAESGIVVANDSAPLHMAVGFDRPCVGLFGPTDPAVVGPYQREHSVVRGYYPSPDETINYKDPALGDSLMRFISTVAVLQAMDRVLAAPCSAKLQAAEVVS